MYTSLNGQILSTPSRNVREMDLIRSRGSLKPLCSSSMH